MLTFASEADTCTYFRSLPFPLMTKLESRDMSWECLLSKRVPRLKLLLKKCRTDRQNVTQLKSRLILVESLVVLVLAPWKVLLRRTMS